MLRISRHKGKFLLVNFVFPAFMLLLVSACSAPATSATETVIMPTVALTNSPTIPPTAIITRADVPTSVPAVAPTENSSKPNTLVLTRAQPSATASGKLKAPGYGKQNYTVFLIDVTDFQTSGTLVIKVTLGEGESDGSFDLYPKNITLPTEGRAKDSIASLYDLKRGKNGTLTHKFTARQVFQFGATGNWFSRENSTNTFTFTATVETTNASSASIPAIQLLAQRPFRPTDITLLFPSVYPDAPPTIDANGSALTEDQARKMLEEYLRVEYPNQPQKVQDGIALFNQRETFLKISSPSLRAALVALRDTLGEPSIDFILRAKTTKGNSKAVLVRFAKFPANRTNTIAMVNPEINPDDPEQILIEFNERFQAENPFLFTNSLAHESLHNDRTNSIVEEEVIYTFDSLIYLQQLGRHRELARAGTWLARFHNTHAVSRLNSGSGSKLGLFDSNSNQPIWPQSGKDTPSFDQRFVDNPGRDSITPGNPLLEQYLQRLVEKGNALPAKIEYSPALLRWISYNQAAVSAEELIAAARALGLDVPGR